MLARQSPWDTSQLGADLNALPASKESDMTSMILAHPASVRLPDPGDTLKMWSCGRPRMPSAVSRSATWNRDPSADASRWFERTRSTCSRVACAIACGRTLRLAAPDAITAVFQSTKPMALPRRRVGILYSARCALKRLTAGRRGNPTPGSPLTGRWVALQFPTPRPGPALPAPRRPPAPA